VTDDAFTMDADPRRLRHQADHRPRPGGGRRAAADRSDHVPARARRNRQGHPRRARRGHSPVGTRLRQAPRLHPSAKESQ
jgi:hypothetical protein